MKNEIKIFNNPQFGNVRVTTNENNEPLFCLADVCKVLDINNVSDLKNCLSKPGVVITEVRSISSNGVEQKRQMNFINEANLYKCIFQSRKPDAEKFQDWVCEEVLPSIRKHGAYATPATIDQMINNPEFGIRLLSQLQEERKAKELAQKEAMEKTMLLETSTQAMKEKDTKIAQDAPKVLFADAVTGSKSTCLVGELAKLITQNGYNIGQNRLFKWLRENGYLGTKGEYYNIPNQQYMVMGLFDVKKTVHDENGVMVTKTTTKVTGKGQQYFLNKFLKRG